MDTRHLISELSNFPSISDSVRELWTREVSIPEIRGVEDVEKLRVLLDDVQNNSFRQNLPVVSVDIMKIQTTVAKPYYKQGQDEDDFI
jgi:hypothetical protein